MKMTVVKKEVDTYRALGTGSTGHYAGPQGVGQQAERGPRARQERFAE